MTLNHQMKKVQQYLFRYSILWVTLYYITLTVIMTWPLVKYMNTKMIGQVGDNVYFVWLIGWFKKAIFELHVNPFDIWFLNYPAGWSLAYTEITPINLLLAMPFSFLGGPVLSYNMAMMLTFVISGLAMYFWIYRLTRRIDAALIAGTIYAFLPYHFAHFLIGHLNLSGTQWFPFYFMGLYDLLQARRWDWKPVLLGGISLGLIGLTSQYYLYMTMIISAFLVICYLVFIKKNLIKDIQFWKRMAVMGLVALPILIMAVTPFVMLNRQGGMPDRNISIVRLYSASPTDFILPSTDHFIWGQWIGDHFNRDLWIEGTFYIGLVSGALAILAWLKRKELRQERLVRLMVWGSVFAFILAMGITFHWLGEEVMIPTPVFLLERLQRSEFPIPLLGYFMFLVFPLYAKLRATMRFGFFVLLFMSIMAGIGSAWLLKQVKRKWQPGFMLLILGLVFFDFYPGCYTELFQVDPRPVDKWLAEQPGQGAVILFPFSMEEDQDQIYYQLIHGKPFVGGFFNAFPPAQYKRIIPVMEYFPDQASIDLIKELGVKYILLDKDEYSNINLVRRECEELGLELIIEWEGILVFTHE